MTSQVCASLLAVSVASWGVGCASATLSNASEPADPVKPATGGGLGVLDQERMFLTTRGSLDPQDEVLFYFKGEIHLLDEPVASASTVPKAQRPILWFDGFNVARFEQREGGVRMLSRELMVYRDEGGAIVDCWRAPWSEKTVRVVHVTNDPVNFTLGSGPKKRQGEAAPLVTPRGGEVRSTIRIERSMRRTASRFEFSSQIDLAYPSPLPLADYPRYSTGDTYRSRERFTFSVLQADVLGAGTKSAAAELTWNRVGQTLPWMQRGARQPASLSYRARGRKLLEGWGRLPADLRRFVQRRYPSYRHPPTTDEAPNQTSWRTFKKLVDDGSYEPTCP